MGLFRDFYFNKNNMFGTNKNPHFLINYICLQNIIKYQLFTHNLTFIQYLKEKSSPKIRINIIINMRKECKDSKNPVQQNLNTGNRLSFFSFIKDLLLFSTLSFITDSEKFRSAAKRLQKKRIQGHFANN